MRASVSLVYFALALSSSVIAIPIGGGQKLQSSRRFLENPKPNLYSRGPPQVCF